MTPENKQPEFGGECAFAVSLGKDNATGNPNCTITEGGRTYYFKNPVARFLWKVFPGRVEKADAAWQVRGGMGS